MDAFASARAAPISRTAWSGLMRFRQRRRGSIGAHYFVSAFLDEVAMSLVCTNRRKHGWRTKMTARAPPRSLAAKKLGT
eukprot:3828790-Pleurochrysis_carterae.AAC.1